MFELVYECKIILETAKVVWFGWLCFTPHRQRGHLLSLAKDVKLGFYTVPTGNRTPSRCVAVHYTAAAQRHLTNLQRSMTTMIDIYFSLIVIDWLINPLKCFFGI